MSFEKLERARALTLPSREAMLNRAPSVQRFWEENRELFEGAWHEWEQSVHGDVPLPDDSLLDPRLRDAIRQAWEDPTKENAVRDLWQTVAPNVYQCKFFDPEKLKELRRYLDEVADADIPLKPPYGIVLNRGGAMLDSRSEGYLAAPGFQAFYQGLMDRYMRPISRLLFPEIAGFDTQTFGFSIRYQPQKDTSIQPHTDASSVTLNINLNLPGEGFTGSELDFYDRVNGGVKRATFTPGMAMIHRGNIAHAAHPITSGERTNLVFWLYGDNGQIPYHAAQGKDLDPAQRWTVPEVTPDRSAPF